MLTMNKKTSPLGVAALVLLSVSCAPTPNELAPSRATTQSVVDRPVDDLPPLAADGFAQVMGSVPRDGRTTRYIVALRDESSVATFDAVVARARSLGTVGTVYRHALLGFSATLSGTAVAELRRMSGVAYIEVVTVVRATVARGLDRIDQRALPRDNRYIVRDGAAGVNVYVVDSGIRTTHNEFGTRAHDFYNAVPDGMGNTDCTGHGTAVASIIGGIDSGVARGVELFSARVIGCDGTGDGAQFIDALNEIRRRFVAPAVVNISVASPPSFLINRAVRRLVQAGVVVVAGAGNGDPSLINSPIPINACDVSPASEPDAITVGNLNPLTDRRADSSNTGTCLDLFAPGVGITTANAQSDFSTNSDFDGTSSAAPHVAGVAALLLAADPSLTPAQVAAKIVENATPNVVIDPGVGSPNRLLFAFAPTNSGDTGWYVGDFNGDGRDDVLRHVGGLCGADMLLSSGSFFVRDGCWSLAGQRGPGWRVRDFNGDGRDDLMRYSGTVDGSSNVEVLLSTGTSFASPVSWSRLSPGDNDFSLGDFNGDGRGDLLRVLYGVTGAQVLRSSGVSFVSAGSWTLANDGDDGWHVGDFNGDGRSDVFRYRAGTTGADMFLSTGTAFANAGFWTSAGSGDDGWYAGDFNGDGRSDIFRYTAGVSGADVFLSNGSAFVHSGSWTLAGHGAEKWRVGDFNGDGRQDLLRAFGDSIGAGVLLSNGTSSFVNAGDWTVPNN
jgi:hypothetical protein